MRIADAYWTAQRNILVIACGCGQRFDHPSDRWRVRCPGCGARDHLGTLRERYRLENDPWP